MNAELITENPWSRITKAVKICNNRSFVAVAYFGKGGSEMLPLKVGSMLVVNASESAVTSGQTCPAELIKLYNQGVHIFSRDYLHSKIFVIGTKLFIGSTNVSSNSRMNLEEVLINTTDRTIIKAAKEYINSICDYELGIESLKRLDKIYKPPKFFGIKKPKSRNHSHKSHRGHQFHLFNLEMKDYTEEEEKQSNIGKKDAAKKRKIRARHTVEEFLWTKGFTSKTGDLAVQIVNESKFSYVSPPGTIIHIRKWRRGNKQKAFFYVEIPTSRRKNLIWVKKQLSAIESKKLNSSGRKDQDLSMKLQSFWKN